MHIIADRSKENLSLHLSQNRVELYELFFSAMSEAILLYTVVAIGPIPPEIENTRANARFLSPSLHMPASSLAHLTSSTALGNYYDKMEHVD